MLPCTGPSTTTWYGHYSLGDEFTYKAHHIRQTRCIHLRLTRKQVVFMILPASLTDVPFGRVLHHSDETISHVIIKHVETYGAIAIINAYIYHETTRIYPILSSDSKLRDYEVFKCFVNLNEELIPISLVNNEQNIITHLSADMYSQVVCSPRHPPLRKAIVLLYRKV